VCIFGFNKNERKIINVGGGGGEVGSMERMRGGWWGGGRELY